jgi:hypothetical protein
MESETPGFRKSVTPVIEAAIDGHFSSGWESQVYHFMLAILQRSMLDDSVSIGTVVLLDLLGDLNKVGRLMDGSLSRLELAPYPHKDYLSYCVGAFMLAHRLLSREGPYDTLFWEEVLGEDGIVTLGEVDDLENDFRQILEDHIDDYAPPPIFPDNPAYQYHYAGDVVIRPNPFISRLRYLKMKETMYAHIRVLMTSRGEDVLEIHSAVRRKTDLALHFPPCQQYMLAKQVFLAQTRRDFPQLEESSDEEVDDFLETRCNGKQSDDSIGLGLVIV